VSTNRAWSWPLLLFLAACTRQAPGPAPIATPRLFTPVPILSTPTLVPSTEPPTPTPSATATAGPFTPFPAKPAVDALKLRVGPGMLFDALLLLNKGDSVMVQGRAPGGEWFAVKTADDIEGWVFGQLLVVDQGLQAAPLTEPQNAQLVRGRLTDSAGLPISGVQFSLTQGQDGHTSAVTDQAGDFYAFLPEDISGDWLVSYDAIACTSNAYADSACAVYKPGYTGVVQPDSQPVTLPTDNTLTFLWK